MGVLHPRHGVVPLEETRRLKFAARRRPTRRRAPTNKRNKSRGVARTLSFLFAKSVRADADRSTTIADRRRSRSRLCLVRGRFERARRERRSRRCRVVATRVFSTKRNVSVSETRRRGDASANRPTETRRRVALDDESRAERRVKSPPSPKAPVPTSPPRTPTLPPEISTRRSPRESPTPR